MATIGTTGQDDQQEPEDTAMGSLFDSGGAPKGGFEGAGRPKEMSKYGKDGSARDRDPLGKNRTPLALAHYDALKKSMKFSKKEILKETKESEEIDNEYDEFVKKD